jgi:hypothetical protein
MLAFIGLLAVVVNCMAPQWRWRCGQKKDLLFVTIPGFQLIKVSKGKNPHIFAHFEFKKNLMATLLLKLKTKKTTCKTMKMILRRVQVRQARTGQRPRVAGRRPAGCREAVGLAAKNTVCTADAIKGVGFCNHAVIY